MQSRPAVRCGGARFVDLLPGSVVVGGPIDLPEDSHDGVLEVLVAEPRQRERIGGIVSLGIVNDDLFGIDVGGLGHFETETALHDTVFGVVAESDRLAVAHRDQPFLSALLAQHVE